MITIHYRQNKNFHGICVNKWQREFLLGFVFKAQREHGF